MINKKQKVIFSLLSALFVLLVVGIAIFFNYRNRSTKIDTDKVDLTLSSDESKVTVGNNINVSVYANTNGLSISAVDLRIRYDQTKLQLLTYKPRGGILPTILKEPVIDNNDGNMSTVIGTLVDANKAYPKSGQNLLIGELTFKSVASGKADINFDIETQVSAVGKDSNIAGNLNGIAIDNYDK